MRQLYIYKLPDCPLSRDSIVVRVLLLASGTQQEPDLPTLDFQSLEKSCMGPQQIHCRHPYLK